MSWTAHGCIVLDRLLNVMRCDEIEIYYESELPPKEVVRSIVSNPAPIRYVPGLCPAVFCFDRIGLRPDDTLCFVDSGLPVTGLATESLTRPERLEVSIEDAVRLKSIIHRYPELIVSDALMDLVNAAYAYVVERCPVDPDATLLLAKYCT